MVTTTSAEGETKYQYDDQGNLIYVKTPNNEVVSYTYDEYGRKESLRYPDGESVFYEYDQMDRLIAVRGLDGTKITYTYNAAGQRTQTSDGELTTEYGYDLVGNLTKQSTTGRTEISFEYLYDLNNRILAETRTESGESVKSEYVYDKLGQIESFQNSKGYSEAYTYDAAGNMTQKSVNGLAISMTFDAANELMTMQSEKGKIAYSYDKNGNLTQKEMDGKKDTYTYDALNRLTSYVGYDGYTQNYTYNAQSMMSAKESKGNPNRQTMEEIVSGKKEEPSADDDDPDPAEWVKTSYTYDVTAPYYEVLTETTNGVSTAYEYGVERISAYEKQSISTQKTNYIYDGRGSVAQALTFNSSWYTFGGTLSEKNITSFSYTPFGDILENNNTSKTINYAYNGESYDSSTGMVNLRARWYEPAMMRFNQRDILRGDQSVGISLNRYIYCENDPVNFLDPSGKSLSELWEKAKTAVSNGAAAVKKVATAAYNAGKTLVTSAVQQAATVAKPVVNKVVNTVKEVATVAKTQGLVATAKTLASNAASLSAYVKNVVSATTAERQAIQAKSAQEISGIANNLNKDLATIGKSTYETLSTRNQKIIDDASTTVRYMQQYGASQAAIDRVIRGACTQLAKNVGETVINGVKEELGKYFFSAPEEAARAFGSIANTLTKQTGNEHMAAIYSMNLFGKKVYYNGYIHEGDNGSVAAPFIATLLSGKILDYATLGFIQYEGFSHTHPDDHVNGNWTWQFSDFQSNDLKSMGGDQMAAILAGRCYMVDQTNSLYELNDVGAIAALLNGDSVNEYLGYNPKASENKPDNLNECLYRIYWGQVD